jgi:hypothetical protein
MLFDTFSNFLPPESECCSVISTCAWFLKAFDEISFFVCMFYSDSAYLIGLSGRFVWNHFNFMEWMSNELMELNLSLLYDFI